MRGRACQRAARALLRGGVLALSLAVIACKEDAPATAPGAEDTGGSSVTVYHPEDTGELAWELDQDTGGAAPFLPTHWFVDGFLAVTEGGALGTYFSEDIEFHSAVAVRLVDLEAWDGTTDDQENLCTYYLAISETAPAAGAFVEEEGLLLGWLVPTDAPAAGDGACDRLDGSVLGAELPQWLQSMTWGVGFGSVLGAGADFLEDAQRLSAYEEGRVLAGYVHNEELLNSDTFPSILVSGYRLDEHGTLTEERLALDGSAVPPGLYVLDSLYAIQL